MPQPQQQPSLLVSGILGRDGASPPLTLAPEMCREAMNIDWYRSTMARRRPGAELVSLMGGTAQTGIISSLFSFVPFGDQTRREMWALDDAYRWKRLAGGDTWADVTVIDPVTANAQEVSGVYFNRKFYFGYDSAVDRLHCFDPTTNTLRRVGISQASVPTVTNGPTAGTYPATLRYYKIRLVQLSGIATIRAGELSSAVSFTPDGAHSAARLTRPALPGEGETHWEVYGSSDGSSYFRISQVAVATTTYDDSTTPTSYAGVVPPDVNAFLAPPAAKYLIADKGRLIFAGFPFSTHPFAKPTRFGWTAPLGSTDNGDDERVEYTSDIKGYDDITEDVNGLGGPVNGGIYVFSANGVWLSTNTGIASSPYSTQKLGDALGLWHFKSIVVAEDETGASCIYWLSPVGPCRHGQSGFSRCHYDIDDIWDRVNLEATMPPHAVFHRDIHQIWWYVPVDGSNECNFVIKFDTALGRVIERNGVLGVRKGFSVADGESAKARCSCMMSTTLGTSMSRRLKPYIGLTTGTRIARCDTGTTDFGTTYQAYIRSRALLPWGLTKKGGMAEEAVLAAQTSENVVIQTSIVIDGDETLPKLATTDLTAKSGEDRVIRRVEGSRVAEANYIEFIVGDERQIDASWNLDALMANVTFEGQA